MLLEKFNELIPVAHKTAKNEVAYSILGDIVFGGNSKGKDVKVDPRELSMAMTGSNTIK